MHELRWHEACIEASIASAALVGGDRCLSTRRTDMSTTQRAERIALLDFRTAPMRAFHMAWMAFFLCFFAWFGIAPLMPIIREELHLTKDQIGWCLIGSVAITIVARLIIGQVCDRYGPRKAYAALLIVGAVPIIGIGLAQDFTSFLIFRTLIGAIGASFVITQYHTSVMFSPKCVGTANATTAGWGNFGGGATQVAMPLLMAGFLTLGFSQAASWRLCMVCVGLACWAMAYAYLKLTQDTPDGQPPVRSKSPVGLLDVARDPRVWVLFIAYAACFGTELTMKNIAALYYVDHFAELKTLDTLTAAKYAGLLAALFGATNIFARTLGGWVSDRFGSRDDIAGRSRWLFLSLFGCGAAMLVFSRMTTIAAAVPAMLLLSTCTQMACGATYGVVPFINRPGLGAVSGIVGAGGNLGAVAFGFLFKAQGLSWPTALLLLGGIVTGCSFLTLLLTFVRPREAAEFVPTSAAPVTP